MTEAEITERLTSILNDIRTRNGGYEIELTPFIRAEVNLARLGARLSELVEVLHVVPNLDGASWRILEPYCGGQRNACLLIAIGDQQGWWRRNPPLENLANWGDRMAPRVLVASVSLPAVEKRSPRGVPKPSRGDLAEMTYCSQCGHVAAMEKEASDQAFGLYIQDHRRQLCAICADAPEGDTPAPTPDRSDPDPPETPEWMEAFLGQVNEP